jgi:murein DD-endopeptidase MepM/ murein hydrolase activator NlpD
MKLHFPLVFAFAIALLWAQASSGETYKVKKGDSLYRIARSYRLTVRDIQEANGLTGIGLRPGQVLEIPIKTVLEEQRQVPEPPSQETPREEAKPPLPMEQPGIEAKTFGDTTVLILKSLLPPEKDRAGYLLLGDTLKVLKRQFKPSSVKQEPVQKEGKVTPYSPSFPHLAQQVVDYALTFLGTPYHYGGTTEEGGFDCSGFVRHVFANFNLDIPHSSREQYALGRAVSKDNLEISDLLFFTRPGHSKGVGHVGIYIGDGQFIHASSGKNKKIVISGLDSTYYVKRYVGARRLSL